MASEVTVTTTMTFIDDDGTTWSDTVNETADAGGDVNRPKRYRGIAGTSYENILDVGTAGTDGFGQTATSGTFCMVINRSSNDMTLKIENTDTKELELVLKPNEWWYITKLDFDVDTTTTYASVAGDFVQAKFENTAGSYELLTWELA